MLKGFTVNVNILGMKGKMNLIRLEKFAYLLKRNEDGTWRGVVKDTSEQRVLNASPGFLASESANHWIQDDGPQSGKILLVPVERDYDCSRLKTEAETLFHAQ